MPAEESKEVDPQTTKEAAEEVQSELSGTSKPHDASDEDEPKDEGDAVAEEAARKRKKSKKDKLKAVLKATGSTGDITNPATLTPAMMEQLLEKNPSLQSEFMGLEKDKQMDLLKKMDISDLLTGMSIGGKNQKDMASYKFWQTQPVPRFDEKVASEEEGPIKMIDPEQVPKEPSPMAEGFEWVTMDLEDGKELEELYELLMGHYVEDEQAMFRFNYSISFLNWCPPLTSSLYSP